MKTNVFIRLAVFTALVSVVALSDVSATTVRVNQSKIRLIMGAQEAKTGSIEVENPSDTALIVKVSTEDWIYGTPFDGTKEFFAPNTTKFSASEWITFYPSEFVLAPFSKQRVNYTVKTPGDFSQGHYAAMFFESDIGATPDPKSSVGMNVIVRIASLFYIEPKAVARQAEISALSVGNGPSNSLIIGADFTNTGKLDITTSATFNVIDKSGVVFARGKFNDIYTFPGDGAPLNGRWKEPLPAGIYDLVFTVDIGKSLQDTGSGRGPVITKEAQLEIGEGGRVVAVGPLH